MTEEAPQTLYEAVIILRDGRMMCCDRMTRDESDYLHRRIASICRDKTRWWVSAHSSSINRQIGAYLDQIVMVQFYKHGRSHSEPRTVVISWVDGKHDMQMVSVSQYECNILSETLRCYGGSDTLQPVGDMERGWSCWIRPSAVMCYSDYLTADNNNEEE